MQRGRIVRSGDGVGVGKMIGLIVRRMSVGAGVCVGAVVGSGSRSGSILFSEPTASDARAVTRPAP